MKFPILMENVNPSDAGIGYHVLFTSRNEGTIVKATAKSRKVGYHSTGWLNAENKYCWKPIPSISLEEIYNEF